MDIKIPVSLVLVLVILYINADTNKQGYIFYTNRELLKKTDAKVYDVSFKYLPDLSDNELLGMLTDSVYITLVMSWVLYKTRAFKELYLSLVVVLFLRAISIRLTILPSQKNCAKEQHSVITGGCYDKLFSGHFATVLIFTMVGVKYNVISIQQCVLINTVHAILILLTRRHYTNDIIMALYAGLTVGQIIMPNIL